jgi:hypothetical protein
MTAEQEKSTLLIFTPRATLPQHTRCKYFSTSLNGGILKKTIWQANLLSQNNSKPQEQ